HPAAADLSALPAGGEPGADPDHGRQAAEPGWRPQRARRPCRGRPVLARRGRLSDVSKLPMTHILPRGFGKAMPQSAVAVIFLPGVIMPCALRYAALLRELDNGVRAITKDLELYAGPGTPPQGYDITMELDGINETAEDAGWDRFHLYGHSGGGAVALGYVAALDDEPSRRRARSDHRAQAASRRSEFVSPICRARLFQPWDSQPPLLALDAGSAGCALPGLHSGAIRRSAPSQHLTPGRAGAGGAGAAPSVEPRPGSSEQQLRIHLKRRLCGDMSRFQPGRQATNVPTIALHCC